LPTTSAGRAATHAMIEAVNSGQLPSTQPANGDCHLISREKVCNRKTRRRRARGRRRRSLAEMDDHRQCGPHAPTGSTEDDPTGARTSHLRKAGKAEQR
jgi:hypothetical protein